jgi:hypothetical protein
MNRIIIFLLLLLSACGSPDAPAGDPSVPAGKVRIKVGDAEIDKGDIDAILLPASWWVDPHGDYASGLRKLSREQQWAYAVTTYLHDTRQEGHYLFFGTTDSLVATDAIEGFRIMGMPAYEGILQQAMRKKQGKDPDEVDFEAEDVALLQLGEGQDPMIPVLSYIRAHRKAFYYDEIVNKP